MPPNCPALIKYSYERATDEYFSLAETWSTSTSDAIADPVNGPLAIVVPYQSNETPPENAQVSPGHSPDTNVISVSEGYHSPTSGTKRKSSTVPSHEKFVKSSTGGRVRSYQDESSSIPATQQTSVTTSVDELHIPSQLNLYDIILRQSERIHKLNQQEKYSKG